MKLTARVSIFNRVSHVERLAFTKHLSTMVKAGIPIAEAVQSLGDSAQGKLKTVLDEVVKDLNNGQSLATSLAKHPKEFDQLFTSLVEIGEESGSLEESMEFLALQLAKDYGLRKKVQAAMLYPSLVIAAATIMSGFIALFVLPQLVDFFDAFEIELPLSTKILLFVANLMRDWGIVIILSLVGLVTLIGFILRQPKIKPKWHSAKLKLPLIGGLIRNDQLARLSRNLGILLKSGVPISRALEITSATMANLKFKSDLEKITNDLGKGKSIATVLKTGQYSQFPSLVEKMIGVGEKTGNLDESLLYLGDFFEDEVDTFSKNLTSVLEPILLLAIGLLVGFVALAIISPIYELTGSVRR